MKKIITRRSFIRTSAGIAGMSSLGIPYLAEAKATINLTGWAFAPELVRENLDRFESMVPGYKVKMMMFAPADFVTRMVALATADQLNDVLYVRAETLEAWVRAEFLQSIDEISGIEEIKEDLIPFVRQGMTVDNKLYGLPYYTDIQVLYYNKDIINKAGFDAPPKSLNELKNQCLKIQKLKLLEYPLVYGFKKAGWSNMDWWTSVFASGGRLFDDQLDPMFPARDKTALEVLNWMVDSVNKWKITDPASVELDVNQVRDLFGSGRYAFVMGHRYDESRYNNPERASASGNIKMGLIPSLDGTTHGTFGIVRMYSLAKNLSNKDGCISLLNYLGYKDTKGLYHTAANWYKKYTLGYGVKGLDSDPELQSIFDKYGNGSIKRKLASVAKVTELQRAPWGAEWESYNYDQIQAAISGGKTPLEALEASAKRAIELKKGY